ncbi:2-amino-4-hydroxy-6-hydroxymethyldihydropteridine diphosphokinase [Bifidobacterium goeldii]|uniref:2-amino-4-hydroxy-6- hydroxymethyldihydropteridine diphosphokinase n=1 Tax=Bifidobacterium goeldii TaxID=2306975 RepID=UPI000F7F5A63|nr:2-amino-4-hydroxy-6-hydroxymethyldihydropteridine diphosphokinase [Bifidobacterium goeldii]
MDTIRLTGVQAMGTHGVLDYEHERAQPFVVDATLHLDLAAAGRSDDLHDTVDYGRVAKRIVSIIEGEHVDLIERLAALIADAILADNPTVHGVNIAVHKPKAPITVPFADVCVSIERWRKGSSGAVAASAVAAGAADADAAETVDAVGAAGAAVTGTSAEVHHAIIALGGNQGDVAATMRDAVARIDALPGTQVRGISPLYRTAAWGMPEGTPDFLNAVIEVATTLDADRLLAELLAIEAAHGRVRETHWSSRTLDLDIIDFDGTVSENPDLTLPHPRAWQRAFVLAPWADLNPDAVLHGEHGGAVAQLLAEAGDRDDVERIDDAWMTAGAATAATADSANATSANASANTSANAQSQQEEAQFHTAIVSMDSRSTNAETLFRSAIVALEGVPGNQVEGISPLYHVAHFEGPDAMSAVVQLTTRMDARTFIATLGSIERAIGEDLDLDLVDMPGVTCNEPDCRVPWPSARNHASVLAPWLDMDPEARLGKDPVSYLLALAPDAERVGMLSDTWIVGGTL